MSENVETTGAPERPSFLTVLCILTFIGSGLGVLGGLLGLFGSTFLAMFAVKGSMFGQLIGLAAAGLCLFGAIKMWGLYKQGFMLYVAGAALSILGGIIGITTFSVPDISDVPGVTPEMAEFQNQLSESADSLLTSAMWTGFGIGLVITVVFVLMYNANRKHLVN